MATSDPGEAQSWGEDGLTTVCASELQAEAQVPIEAKAGSL